MDGENKIFNYHKFIERESYKHCISESDIPYFKWCINSIPVIQKQLILLHAEGYSYIEIASLLQISPEKTRSLIITGRRTLSKLILNGVSNKLILSYSCASLVLIYTVLDLLIEIDDDFWNKTKHDEGFQRLVASGIFSN